MNPATIIREAQADGVSLTLPQPGTIKASGNGATVNRWLAVIREHKAEIIGVLRVGEAGMSDEASWLLHFTDRDPQSVSFCPSVTHAEALAHYPEAIAAEPIPERPRRAATEAEARELRGLIQAVYGSEADADRAEALGAALNDPAGALRCYRAILKARTA
jgi:hypothetical protein